MFDASFAEIVLVAVVALLVLGPERLPRAAKMAGLWLRRAKASWYSVKAEFERELADDELKRSLDAASEQARAAANELEAATRLPPVDGADPRPGRPAAAPGADREDAAAGSAAQPPPDRPRGGA